MSSLFEGDDTITLTKTEAFRCPRRAHGLPRADRPDEPSIRTVLGAAAQFNRTPRRPHLARHMTAVPFLVTTTDELLTPPQVGRALGLETYEVLVLMEATGGSRGSREATRLLYVPVDVVAAYRRTRDLRTTVGLPRENPADGLKTSVRRRHATSRIIILTRTLVPWRRW